MAVAYFMVHAAGKAIDHAPTPTEQFFPILNKGELAVVLLLVFSVCSFLWAGTLEHRLASVAEEELPHRELQLKLRSQLQGEKINAL